MKMKPKTTLKLEELLHALEPVKKYIPIEKFDQFYLRVHSAIEIYLELEEPTAIAKELREINKICQKPNYTLLNVLENISKSTRELMSRTKPLPPFPSAEDGVGIKALAKEIRQRIVVSGKILSDRTGHRLIGPSKVGRPSKDRLKVLVSLVAFAYVSATGKSYRRKWDSDTETEMPVNQILKVIFVSLCIEDSVDEAIRRQRTKQQLSEEKYT